MDKKTEEVSNAILSQLAIVEEHESDPTSEQYKASIDSLKVLFPIFTGLIETELKEEETRKNIEFKERETLIHEQESDARIAEMMAKIDELENRGDQEIRKLKWQLLGIGGLGAFAIWWESKGHVIKDGVFKAIGTVKRLLI